MLDIRRLQVLTAVARHGSISGAAAAMSYTPSAVSQKITALERDVGIGLVRRGAHGTELTVAGGTLLRHADDILGRIADAEQELGDLVGLRTGILRLGAFSTASTCVVPRVLRAFRDDHPRIDVTLSELAPEDAVAKLRARELEAALVYRFPALPGAALDGVRYNHLVDDPLYVALPPGHNVSRRGRLRLRELADEPWIQGVQYGASLQILPAACRASGFEPRIVIRSNDYMAVQGYVAAGFGVALIPMLALPTARSDITLRALADEHMVRQVGVAVPDTSYQPPAVTALLEVLAAVCPEFSEQKLTRRSRRRAAMPAPRSADTKLLA